MGSKDVVVHTPNSSGYTDLAQNPGLAPSPYMGGRTVIPQATAEGMSRGFDPHKPGRVVVHSGPDGAETREQEGIDPLVPPRPVKAAAEQALAQVKAVNTGISVPAVPLSVLLPETGLPKTTQPAGAPELSTDLVIAVARALAGMQGQAKTPEKPPGPPVAVVAATPDPPDHGMAFLTSPPSKPACELLLDMGTEAGAFLAHYHAIAVDAKCVVLVYDGRYTAGMHWVPGFTGQRVLRADIRLPGMKPQETITRHVGSMGLTFTLGCLDLVVLPVTDDVPDESPAEG